MRCPRCQHENPPQAKFCLGMTVVRPGTNFATSMPWAPNRAKTLSERRTQESGSSDKRHRRVSTLAPRRRPSSYQAKSTASATMAIAPSTRVMLPRPWAARAPTPQERRHRRERNADLLGDDQGGKNHHAVPPKS
jgi:hypothetical protein